MGVWFETSTGSWFAAICNFASFRIQETRPGNPSGTVRTSQAEFFAALFYDAGGYQLSQRVIIAIVMAGDHPEFEFRK
jgi:hypothetical protein